MENVWNKIAQNLMPFFDSQAHIHQAELTNK